MSYYNIVMMAHVQASSVVSCVNQLQVDIVNKWQIHRLSGARVYNRLVNLSLTFDCNKKQ